MSEDELREESGEEQYEGPNKEARALVDEMFLSMSYVDKEGTRYATSIEEANLGEELLDKAEALIEDESDTELLETIKANREHIEDARTRSFTFAWWLVIAAGIVVAFNFYSAFNTMGKRITETEAVSRINSEKGYLERSIATYDQKEVLTDGEEEYLERSKERLAELKEISPEDFASDYKSSKIKAGLSGILGALFGLAWVVGYIFASRPYGYMQYKRKREYAIIQTATGWGAKLASGILGVFWSIPITTYVTKYTDGTEERDSDALMVLGLQVAVTVIVIGSILLLATIIIPFVTLLAYIRNYPDMIGAKQVHSFIGEGKGFISNYIDKLKAKAA